MVTPPSRWGGKELEVEIAVTVESVTQRKPHSVTKNKF